MSEPITPKQALRSASEVACCLQGADPPIPKDAVQALLEDRNRLEQLCMETVDLFRRHALALVNPHRIVTPTRDYPVGWEMLGWEDQLTRLNNAFQKQLDDTGLRETAEACLAQKDLWEPKFDWPGDGKEHHLWDGLLVIPLPGKVAKKLRGLDLWTDVARGQDGTGLWGRLLEEILFPRFSNFTDWRNGQMGSDRFLPEDSITQWFQEQEARAPGDFICRRCNFRHLFAGHSVAASRWSAEHEHDGLVAPTWPIGWYAITDPSCLTPDSLWLDAAGDRYRFGGSGVFDDAPYFGRRAGGLRFTTSHVGSPNGCCGSVLVSRQ